MTREHIVLGLCNDPGDWTPRRLLAHPAFNHFAALMQHREYRPDALVDAWIWFSAGWDADDSEGS